ncbi:tetratricopeptide repeat protein [Niveibacterium sp.]|uniref:tetratricopeptide repeat protein n=1 Tax=Niveibacterium sp. TaxID=2017444 RepID=UPI0035B4D5FA
MSDLPAWPAQTAMKWTIAGSLVVASQLGHPAMALDITSLWDFGNPALSEQRFRDALNGASADEALTLQTQIARSYGLRNELARARETLASICEAATRASPEVRVRYALELGRTWASAAHSPESQTPATRDTARRLYTEAFEIARDAKLDYLAIDALHMMAFVDTEPAAQLAWDLKALAYMEASPQAEAKRWEGSLRNNIGYALHLQGRYDEAMTQLRLALAAREREGKPERIREAWWMIAWTLRAQGKLDDALAIQLRLEREWDAAGKPDADVFEELELLYRAKGNAARAAEFAEKRLSAN